jgi:threonine aldolase
VSFGCDLAPQCCSTSCNAHAARLLSEHATVEGVIQQLQECTGGLCGIFTPSSTSCNAYGTNALNNETQAVLCPARVAIADVQRLI